VLKEIKKRVITLTGHLERMEEKDRYVQESFRKVVKEKYQRRCVDIIKVDLYAHREFGCELG
jgi:aspartyl aminopeptidase